MRVALYVRVSTQRQAQQQNVEQQVEQQVEQLRAHVTAHAEEESWEIREESVFRDDGYSGATLRRPGLDRLRDAVAARALDLVLVTAPDRLARNYVHQMLLLEELERNGCQVAFLDRPMSQDPHDHLLLQIRGAVAEYERTLIAERMRRGRLRKLQAGVLLPWTKAPYGYRLGLEHPRDPAGVWVEPTEAAIVGEIFARYLQTAGSLGGLAKYLTAQGLPSPMGKACWKGSSVRGILTNPAYTGHVYAGRVASRPARIRRSALQPVGPRPSATAVPSAEWLPVAVIPALVSQDQFDQVQAKLALNRQFARRHNTAHPYLLRALVSCGQCRLACLGRCTHPGYTYYLCRGKAHKVLSGRAEKCRARFIPAQHLDEVVWQDLCEVLLHPSSMTQALERAQGDQWAPQELQARRTHLRRAAEGLASQLERLTDAYLNGVMPLAEYQRRRAAVQQQMQTMQRQLNQLEVDAQRHRNLAGLTQSVEAFCRRLQGGLEQAPFEQKRQLVELLIDRVVVTNDDVEIRYVIPTTPSSEHVRFCHLRTDYFHPFIRIIAADIGRFLHRLDGLGIHDGSTGMGIPAQALTFRVV
jgi:site-specific DNA recombinase